MATLELLFVAMLVGFSELCGAYSPGPSPCENMLFHHRKAFRGKEKLVPDVKACMSWFCLRRFSILGLTKTPFGEYVLLFLGS